MIKCHIAFLPDDSALRSIARISFLLHVIYSKHVSIYGKREHLSQAFEGIEYYELHDITTYVMYPCYYVIIFLEFSLNYFQYYLFLFRRLQIVILAFAKQLST